MDEAFPMVISMLRVLMYAKDVEKIPFYTGESVKTVITVSMRQDKVMP